MEKTVGALAKCVARLAGPGRRAAARADAKFIASNRLPYGQVITSAAATPQWTGTAGVGFMKMKRSLSLGLTIQSKPDFCPECDGRRIITRGLRKNSFRQLQIYWCKDCGGYFVPLVGMRGVKYPPRVIARTLCLYNLGHSQEAAARRIALEHRPRHSYCGGCKTPISFAGNASRKRTSFAATSV